MLLLIAAFSTSITLDAVYAKVKSLPGVEIAAEMVRPSSVSITFKIAPGGHLWAKYPTSEQFISLKDSVTWMPDSRQFSRSKPEAINPLPAGFDVLWPGGSFMTSVGEPQSASFANRNAVKLLCKREGADYITELYVDPSTLLPVGTIASANGMTYEIRYKSVKVAPILPSALTFIAPPDARPYSQERPDTRLIKPGTVVNLINGKDAEGKTLSSKALMKGKRGLVINFWFSACTGCIQEMPFLAKLHRQLKKQQFELMGVNPIDPLSAVRKTSETNRLPFQTLVGSEAKKASQNLGVMAYPVTIVVDANGIVVDSILGFSEARLLAALEKIGFSRDVQ